MTTQEELFSDVEMGTVISCPVCRDVYNMDQRSPLNIPCGHTVCTQCSTSLLPRNGTPVVMCPVCRKRHFGQSQNGVCTFNFPKNYQLLEVIETVSRLKQQADRRLHEHSKVKCIECEAEVSEETCTTCTCMRGPSCNEFDFMGRAKNKLICINCIIANHAGGAHDAKPIEAVKAASDNHKLMNELKATFERLKSKTEGAQLSLNNCKEELGSVQQEMNNVMAHINENPKNNSTFCTVAKFLAKLGELDKTVEGIGKVAHKDATNIGAHAKAIKECVGIEPTIRPPPAEEQNRPRMMNDMRMVNQPPPALREVRRIPEPARAVAPPQRPVPVVPAPVPVVEENPPVPEPENVQIFIHMREGAERERHVREAMEQFMGEHPDAIAIGNAPGAPQVVHAGRNDERLNGLVRGIFEFVDGVMAGERQQGNGNNGAANGELLDEVALVEQQVADGAPRQLVRRRVQLRLQVARNDNNRANAPAEAPRPANPAPQPANLAPRPANPDPQPANPEPEDVEMDVLPVEEPAAEEPAMEELNVEEPAAAPRRRGRPRGQPAPAQQIARVGARRAAEEPVAAGNARNARRNRRAAGRN